MKFLKANLNRVSCIFGFIALALVTPAFTNYASFDSLTEYQVIQLIGLGLLAASAIIYIVIGYQNKISVLGLELAVALFLLSDIVVNSYSVIKDDSTSAIPSIVWNGICLVLVTLSISKQKLNLFTIIFLGIVIAFDFAEMYSILYDKYQTLARVILGLLSLFYYYVISTSYIRNINDDNDAYFN